MLKENLDLICYNKCSFSAKLKSQKGKFSMLNRQIVVMWCQESASGRFCVAESLTEWWCRTRDAMESPDLLSSRTPATLNVNSGLCLQFTVQTRRVFFSNIRSDLSVQVARGPQE